MTEQKEQPDRPTIVCLCGSTRFKEVFFEEAKRLTCEGYIVLAPFHFRKMGDALTPELEVLLTNLHFAKIDLADEVLILNVDNYIGESTQQELSYAYEHNKAVRFLQPSKALDFNWNSKENRIWKDTKGGIR